MKIDISKAIWRKSSYSQGGGQQCVEVATNLPSVVAIRDSKNPRGGQHIVNTKTWSAFVVGIRNDGF